MGGRDSCHWSKRPLENEDLFPLLDEDKTQTSTEKLQQTWSEETAKRVPGKKGRGHRLFKALIRMFPWTNYMVLLIATLIDAIGHSLQPVFMCLLLLELMRTSVKDPWLSYIYAAGTCLGAFLRVMGEYYLAYNGDLLVLRWKSATNNQKVRRS